MIAKNEIRICKKIILCTILLQSVISHADENERNVFGGGNNCIDPIYRSPLMINPANICKSTSIFTRPIKEKGSIVPEQAVKTDQPVEPTTQANKQAMESSETRPSNAIESKTDSGVDISRQILRETETSLNAREKELSLGFHYAKNDAKSDLRMTRGRVLTMPIEFNMGITNRLSLHASLPLVYYRGEVITTASSSKSSDSAVGSLTLGLSYKARKESDKHPSITTSISTSIPTKKSLSGKSKADGLSSGFIGARAGVSVSKSISPAILFFNLSYKHYFPESNSLSHLLPGDSISYGYGAGLSINSVLTFSGRVAGHYSMKSKRDGKYLLGTNAEPVSLNLSINYKLDKKMFLSYGVQFGINNDANDSAMSLAFVWGV